MLEQLLDIKATHWGLDSEEYNDWKEYFLTLSEEELLEEYRLHFETEWKCFSSGKIIK